MFGESLGGALEVRLVCVVENSLSVAVELALEIHAHVKDAPLVVLRFGVDQNVGTTVLALLGDFIESVEELLREGSAIGKGFADRRTSTSKPAIVSQLSQKHQCFRDKLT
jgi:hypothetical protein